MPLTFARWTLPLAVAALAGSLSLEDTTPAPGFKGVAYFESPRSIGTPIDDIARDYTGLGLADKIAGRLRLDTDASLNHHTRNLIRRRLAS